jgi:hypothetical protein
LAALSGIGVAIGVVWVGTRAGTAGPPARSAAGAQPQVIRPDTRPADNDAPAPIAAGVAARIRDTPTGQVMFHGSGLVVDRVANGTQRLTRLSIAGRFPMRDLDATVLLDGHAVGRGIPTADLHSLRILLPRTVHLRTGATVSYRYGAANSVGVGTLTAGR